MKLRYSDFDRKYDFLWNIYNKLGCRDLKLAYSYKGKDNNIYFSKWVLFEELLHLDFNEQVKGTIDKRNQFIKKASHRTVLDIEILIDIDEKGKYKSIKNKTKAIIKKLKKFKFDYVCSTTGSKGYHISLIFPELRGNNKSQEFRSYFLSSIGADIQKASSKSMIALEGMPHWKSGKIKQEVIL